MKRWSNKSLVSAKRSVAWRMKKWPATVGIVAAVGLEKERKGKKKHPNSCIRGPRAMAESTDRPVITMSQPSPSAYREGEGVGAGGQP